MPPLTESGKRDAEAIRHQIGKKDENEKRDLKDVQELNVSSLAEEDQASITRLSKLEHWRADPSHSRLWVVRDERRQIFGYILGRRDPTGEFAEIREMAFDQRALEKDYGSKLLQACTDAMIASGVSRITFWIDPIEEEHLLYIATNRLRPGTRYRQTLLQTRLIWKRSDTESDRGPEP